MKFQFSQFKSKDKKEPIFHVSMKYGLNLMFQIPD